MITQLSVRNFKSWRQIDNMRFAPITGLFGTNSSGKTSVLQLLLMIKQTVESTDRLQVLDFGNEKSPANLGSFQETVFTHATPGSMEWSLRWKLTKPLVIKTPENKEQYVFRGDEIGFRVAIAESEKKRLQVSELKYSFGGREFIMERKAGGKNNYELIDGVIARSKPLPSRPIVHNPVTSLPAKSTDSAILCVCLFRSIQHEYPCVSMG